MAAAVTGLLDMDTPMLALALFQPFFSAFAIYYFMRRLLPGRLNNYALVAMALVYTLWFNLRTPELFGTAYHLWMNVFINAWTIFVIVFLFQGKFWRKLMVWWYFDIIKTMCQAVAYIPILFCHARRGVTGDWAFITASVEADNLLKLIYLTAFVPLLLLLGFLSVAIWRRVLMRKFHPFYLLFLFLPMGQLYSLALVIHPNMGDLFFGILLGFIDDVDVIYNILALFGIAAGIVSCAAILCYVVSYDGRAAIEAELNETKRRMELEQARYEEMEQWSEELARIRHDLNNQLASIIQLIRAGEDAAAQEIITALMNEINPGQDG